MSKDKGDLRHTTHLKRVLFRIYPIIVLEEILVLLEQRFPLLVIVLALVATHLVHVFVHVISHVVIHWWLTCKITKITRFLTW